MKLSCFATAPFSSVGQRALWSSAFPCVAWAGGGTDGHSCIADHHSGEGQRRELSSQEDTGERGNCLFQRLLKRSSGS